MMRLLRKLVNIGDKALHSFRLFVPCVAYTIYQNQNAV